MLRQALEHSTFSSRHSATEPLSIVAACEEQGPVQMEIVGLQFSDSYDLVTTLRIQLSIAFATFDQFADQAVQRRSLRMGYLKEITPSATIPPPWIPITYPRLWLLLLLRLYTRLTNQLRRLRGFVGSIVFQRTALELLHVVATCRHKRAD